MSGKRLTNTLSLLFGADRRRRTRLARGNCVAATTRASIAAVALATLAAPAHQAFASDHIDSPVVTQDRGTDLGDMWAFLDPNDNSQVILIMSTQGFIVSGEAISMPIFDHNIRYRFEIENTGDAKPDKFVDVYYAPGLGRETTQKVKVVLPNGRSFYAETTVATHDPEPPAVVVTVDPRTGAKFFGGNADDPFFLDNTGANRVVVSVLEGNPDLGLLSERGRDTYAGLNTLITAVSVPASMLRGKGDVIGVNAVTQRQRYRAIVDDNTFKADGDWVTVDRDGTPLVNNGLIPPPRKDEFNAASTEDDAKGRFRADIVASLRTLGTRPEFVRQILEASVTNGDILRIDLGVPNQGKQGGINTNGGFGNMGGRRLADDVVDATFTLINNGAPTGDRVDANELTFRDEFPFVADPHQPFPPGDDPEDLTRQ